MDQIALAWLLLAELPLQTPTDCAHSETRTYIHKRQLTETEISLGVLHHQIEHFQAQVEELLQEVSQTPTLLNSIKKAQDQLDQAYSPIEKETQESCDAIVQMRTAGTQAKRTELYYRVKALHQSISKKVPPLKEALEAALLTRQQLKQLKGETDAYLYHAHELKQTLKGTFQSLIEWEEQIEAESECPHDFKERLQLRELLTTLKTESHEELDTLTHMLELLKSEEVEGKALALLEEANLMVPLLSTKLNTIQKWADEAQICEELAKRELLKP